MFTLQGGPQILGLADQLSGAGDATLNFLDTDPFLDKHCSRLNSGSYCKASTAEGVEMFEQLQRAINIAAKATVAPGDQAQQIKVDGVIGPATAKLAYAVLISPMTRAEGRVKTWIEDPRSTKPELMAPLLASQPQYAQETFAEIAASVLPSPVLPGPPPTTTVPATPPTTTPATIPAAKLPAAPPPQLPKVFWTRKRKIIAFAGAGVLTVGLVGLILWMRRGRD